MNGTEVQLNTPVALLLLAVFVLPGFVVTMIRERTYEVHRDFKAFDRVMATLYYSVLVHAVFLTLMIIGNWLFPRHFPGSLAEAHRTFNDDLPFSNYILIISTLMVISIATAEVGRSWKRGALRARFRRIAKIADSHEVDSAWDQAFTHAEPQYVIRVLLKSGRAVIGSLGEQGFASVGIGRKDVYLSEQWVMNNKLEPDRRLAGSKGVWIAGEEIETIEFVGHSSRFGSESGIRDPSRVSA